MASPRPTVVVVLPSPAGVGLMAVVRISLPSGLSLRTEPAISPDLAKSSPVAVAKSTIASVVFSISPVVNPSLPNSSWSFAIVVALC